MAVREGLTSTSSIAPFSAINFSQQYFVQITRKKITIGSVVGNGDGTKKVVEGIVDGTDLAAKSAVALAGTKDGTMAEMTESGDTGVREGIGTTAVGAVGTETATPSAGGDREAGKHIAQGVAAVQVRAAALVDSL
ncbi:hypothetical protein HDU86_006252 [Geranomyces michiganensis]|nr:hypothetical protein HDU86_006252 [Geranomyces michiganensis]